MTKEQDDLREKRNPLSFSSQLDKKYQYVVDKGIAPDLESANLCWVASIEMAISPFISSEEKRNAFMHCFVNDISSTGKFDQNGRFGIDEQTINLLVNSLTKTTKEQSERMNVSYIFGIKWDDFQEQLNDGAILIFGVKEKKEDPTSHVMVMDKILFQDGDYAVFNSYDPAGENEMMGRRIMSNREMHLRHVNNQGVTLPFIISFKKA